MSKIYIVKEIEDAMRYAKMADTISLNMLIYNGEEGDECEFGSLIADDGPSPEDELLEQDKRELVHKFISRYLTDKEQEVIKMRFGLDDGEFKTLEEVGQKFGISRERIRQIEAKAIRKLRARFAQHHIRRDDV